MNHFSIPLALAAGLLALPAVAAPGAHGPNGEHLDAPATSAAGGKASPRIEAKSELFEIVGTLAGGELSLLIDRFATNEPLLKATVEVESGGLKAKAKFHADIGDFSVDDAALLKKLSTPGEHAVVITVLAGQDSDLLDGVLRVTQPVGDTAHGHAHGTPWGRWALGGAAVAVVLGGLAWRRRQAAMEGGQA